MYKILFVCAGNICRSPTAEGYMKKIVKEHGWSDYIFVDSAGTSSYHSGDAPDLRSIECALCHGLNIRDLRSRPVKGDDFAEFDLILAMDGQNVWNLGRMRPQGDKRYEHAKIKKLLEYAPEFGENVPDPYYGEHGFQIVYEMIAAACENLLADLKETLKLR